MKKDKNESKIHTLNLTFEMHGTKSKRPSWLIPILHRYKFKRTKLYRNEARYEDKVIPFSLAVPKQNARKKFFFFCLNFSDPWKHSLSNTLGSVEGREKDREKIFCDMLLQ